MTAEKISVVVIGSGVIGLACARELSMRGIDTLIIERHDRIRQEINSSNSEIIHAGLYYPPGSLEARLCVQGNRALYDYYARRGIAYKRCGKLIVATAQEAAWSRRIASSDLKLQTPEKPMSTLPSKESKRTVSTGS